MSGDPTRDWTAVWHAVRQWPPRKRLALATQILQSLDREVEGVSVSKERREALYNLIGIWKTDNPPGDDEVEQIVDNDRMNKYN